jgi:HEAT repeat protein
VKWTPAIGARAAVARLGEKEALRQLCELLSGDVSTVEIVDDPWYELIADIAGSPAAWVQESDRRIYWPRAWAARALCYVVDVSATAPLVDATRDDHWRVRMNSVRALGIIGDAGTEMAVIAASRDANPRVRAAAATALGSLGGDEAYDLLTGLVADPDARVIARAEVALERLARSGV